MLRMQKCETAQIPQALEHHKPSPRLSFLIQDYDSGIFERISGLILFGVVGLSEE